MKEYKIAFSVIEEDFERVFKRKPINEDEFWEFGRMCRKGMENQIDWDIIFDCVKDEME